MAGDLDNVGVAVDDLEKRDEADVVRVGRMLGVVDELSHWDIVDVDVEDSLGNPDEDEVAVCERDERGVDDTVFVTNMLAVA